ncbi:MAG TPA: lytic transglycosylase [Syntrophobacteraceae bacterium]|nr:lytic transglycosylase [Syntrophobacteraceae bacterium]
MTMTIWLRLKRQGSVRHVLGRGLWGLTLLIVGFAILSPLAEAMASEQDFVVLQKKLAADGFPPQKLARIFSVDPPNLQLKMVATMFRLRESKLNYDQFLEPPAIQQALLFLNSHRTILAQAERRYGVEPYVIVALLLVETHFGDYTGRPPTLAILSTYALMDQGSYRDRVWALLEAADRVRIGREAFDAKLIRRAEWGYQELCALLRWTNTDAWQLREIQGSLMGAMGMPQFIPSTLERYGADGDFDGIIDLFQTADAVMSIANYLHSLGWSTHSTTEEQEKIIYQYNHSRPYVDCILGIASRLRVAKGNSGR